jgi:hypothetical protein
MHGSIHAVGVPLDIPSKIVFCGLITGCLWTTIGLDGRCFHHLPFMLIEAAWLMGPIWGFFFLTSQNSMINN